MLPFITKYKAALGGGAAMLLLGFVYLNYFSGSTAPLTATSPTDVSGDLLVTLNSLHTIRLDNSIFSDPVFASLSDFGTTLPTQQAGRRNPFAAVGTVTTAGGSVTAPVLPKVPSIH